MATTKSWYPKKGEEYEPTDFVEQSNQASGGGDWKSGAVSQFYGNYNNVMQGNPQANNYNKETGWTMPNDYSSDVNATMNTGGSAYYALASNSMGDQKANGSSDLNQFAGQNDAAVADYYDDNKFGYSDPYGFMDMALGMDGDIQDALSAYANNSFSNYLVSPEYAKLADQYMQNGRLAYEDVLGTASQMSGGLDSSYALAAASQAYNNYMGQLQDAAQNAYQNQFADQAKQLSALQGQQETYLGAYGDDWNRAFDTFTDDDDRMYKWTQFVRGNMENDREFKRDQLNDPYATKNEVDYGNANLGHSYDVLDEEARQFDEGQKEEQRQFDANLGYKYYDTDAGNATDIQKAYISAASKGSSGSGSSGNVTAKDMANTYLSMADDFAKKYDYKSQQVLLQAANMALTGNTAGAQELVNSLFQ